MSDHDEEGTPSDHDPESAQPPAPTHTCVTRIKTIRSHPADQPQQTELFSQIELYCSICDVRLAVAIPGPHIAQIIRGLQEAVAMYPELVKTHTTEPRVQRESKIIMPRVN